MFPGAVGSGALALDRQRRSGQMDASWRGRPEGVGVGLDGVPVARLRLASNCADQIRGNSIGRAVAG
jgi:hypothetical protein